MGERVQRQKSVHFADDDKDREPHNSVKLQKIVVTAVKTDDDDGRDSISVARPDSPFTAAVTAKLAVNAPSGNAHASVPAGRVLATPLDKVQKRVDHLRWASFAALSLALVQEVLVLWCVNAVPNALILVLHLSLGLMILGAMIVLVLLYKSLLYRVETFGDSELSEYSALKKKYGHMERVALSYAVLSTATIYHVLIVLVLNSRVKGSPCPTGFTESFNHLSKKAQALTILIVVNYVAVCTSLWFVARNAYRLGHFYNRQRVLQQCKSMS